ncbi:MAG TPA: hypothetical protein VFS05_12645 [Gemmatimonadaceae bacterium]|nr:hypothetical protein [Gemmatimonadaceae bacterium]
MHVTHVTIASLALPLVAAGLLLPGALAGQGVARTEQCTRGPVPLTLSRPFIAADSVTLLRGELVANGGGGSGSYTIEYLTHIPPSDSVARREQAAALVRVVAPLTGSTPFTLLTLRACAPGAGGALELVEEMSFAQEESRGEWQAEPPRTRHRGARGRS